MKFRDLQLYAKDLPAFNLNDLRKFDPCFHRQQLYDWLERGYVKPLANGYYIFAEMQMNESYLFMLANKIYEPSYISRESALAHYLVIPETVLEVTSISSRKTKEFQSQWVRFSYRTIKPALMFGYQIIEIGASIKYKIACLEKTVLDYLYWNKSINSIDDFAGLRWNKQELIKLVDNPLFMKYLMIFNNQVLKRRVELLMEYIHA